MVGSSPGAESAGTVRTPHRLSCQPCSNGPRSPRLPPSRSRAQSARLSSRGQNTGLSYRAHTAKVIWEAAHGEPCPYARPAPPKRKRCRGPAAAIRNSSSRYEGLPASGVPQVQEHYCGFGSGFCSVSSGQHLSRLKNASPAPGVGNKGKVKPGRRRKTPTLLEMHRRVIDAALHEISRPRERPFENLGERLGGDHDSFTYCSPDGDVDASTEPITGLAGSTGVTAAKRSTSSGLGKRRALMRARGRARPSTNPCFRTQTADALQRSMALPRCNEPWKIPLLRTSWTLTNDNYHRATDDSLCETENHFPDPEVTEADKDGSAGEAVAGPAADTARSRAATVEVAAQSNVDAEQGIEKMVTPPAENPPSLSAARISISHCAAEHYVEEIISNILRARPVEERDTNTQMHVRGAIDAASLLGAPVVGVPASCVAAKLYVEETMTYALRESAVMASVPMAQSGVEKSPEEVIAVAMESRAMACKCSKEYLWQGLQSRLAGALGGGTSCSGVEADTNKAPSDLLERSSNRSKHVASISPELTVSEKGCIVSGGSGTTTPTSGSTTPMSSDSSAIDFALNDDSSAGTGDVSVDVNLYGQNIHDKVGAGAGGSYTTARIGAVSNAATTVVEEWIFDAIGLLVRQPSFNPAVIKGWPSLTVDQVDMAQVKENAALNGQPLARDTDIPGADHIQEPPGAPLGAAMKVLPQGFLKEIAERRASLKPVTASWPTSASVAEDRRQEVGSSAQRERCAAQEAAERAGALRELEVLVRAKGLDRYHPDAFLRGVLYGEGKHSVVYSAYVARGCRDGRGREPQDNRGAVSAAPVTSEAFAASVAKETSVEVFTAAVATRVSAETIATTSLATTPTVFAAALIESVIPASISAVAVARALENVGATIATLAAKEFRYARAEAPASILNQALREVSMHLRVSGCPRVVALRGVWLSPRVTILLEPMDGGNLHRFVRTRPAEGGEHGREGRDDRSLAPSEAARLVAEATDGLAALHDAGIVHRDVKSHNVMVFRRPRGEAKNVEPVGGSDDDSGWEAKLGDLGSATLIPPDGHAPLTEETGTSGWMAPEVFGGQGYGTSADVFSLGILIWDTFVHGTLDNPLCGLSGEACKLREGLRPPWPRPPLGEVPPGIERLAERCWKLEPRDRPTARAVAAELLEIAASEG